MSETKIRNNQIMGGIDGWIPVADIYPFSFTLGSTSGVQSFIDWNDTMDMCSYLQKGMKIQWTQNSTVKYAYIIRVEADAGLTHTETTLAGDLVLNTTTYPVTNIKFSMLESPFGFPSWFNYTPTSSGGGSMTVSITAIGTAKFGIRGESVTTLLELTLTTGGTPSTYLNISTPVNPSDYSGASGLLILADSIYEGGVANARTSDNHFRVFRFSGANWGLGATRYVRGTITYPF